MGSIVPSRQQTTAEIAAEIASRAAAGKPVDRLIGELQSRSLVPGASSTQRMRKQSETDTAYPQQRVDKRERRRKAAALIQHWLDDKSDHDERFWPVLEKELENIRLRCRE